MKKILGLDIGVSSVGLAIVTDDNGTKAIENLSVRIIPEDPDFHGKFYSGNTASKNEGRTEKRGIRRNNQRFKLRRDKLYKTLRDHNMFPEEQLFNLSARELYGLRAKAAIERISLQELGRVLILLNQRRGFLSNRKSVSAEENSSDYKERIKLLESSLDGKTIGQQLHRELESSAEALDVLLRERTYLRSSYLYEFDTIWDCQSQYHPQLTGGPHCDNNKSTLYDLIRNQTIFYQRPLKSQKGLISECPFEKHHKAIAKSSPYFEMFRIWQRLNDLEATLTDGSKRKPTPEQKQRLFDILFYGKDKLGEIALGSDFKLKVTNIKKVLGLKLREGYLNFTELDGSKTFNMLRLALESAGISAKKQSECLSFNIADNDPKGGLFELWHITYSLPDVSEVSNALQKRFSLTQTEADTIADNVAYASDYGSLSTRAVRKLLPYMIDGKSYSDACDAVGYDHSGYKTVVEPQKKLQAVKQNSLRNPVVEQVLNQVVNMVNLAIDTYGPFEEIRVELARELRNSAKTRKNISASNAKNKRRNDQIRNTLRDEFEFNVVNGRDVKRYILWEETNKQCLYCNNPITNTDLLNGNADIEHILPKSRTFSNAMDNFILSHRKCNAEKGQMTAYDFMAGRKNGGLQQYVDKVNELYKDGKGTISRRKFENLLCKGEDIPSDFVERMKKDSQYIAKEAVKMLKAICPKVHTSTGQITDYLREHWGLKLVLEELSFQKYKAIGQTEQKEIKDRDNKTKTIEVIKDWSKRDDHRHHAVDALITALTDPKIIYRLNNLNKIYQYEKDALSPEELADIEDFLGGRFSFKEYLEQTANIMDCPVADVRKATKRLLEDIFISFKKNNSKVLSPKTNRLANGTEQKTWVPRKRLHEETVMGQAKRLAEKKLKLDTKFPHGAERLIVSPAIQELVTYRLALYGGDPKLAFDKKQLAKDPLVYKGRELDDVAVWEYTCTKRVPLTENFTAAQVAKIADKAAKEAIEQHIASNGGSSGSIKQAFKDLAGNPVRHKNGKTIKRVTVYDESKTVSTVSKKDRFGNEILDETGKPVPTGFVKTGGNHHALIFRDENGNFRDRVVSFWEAVAIGLSNIEETGKPYPIIMRKDDPELGTFQFSMQINDLFVFDLKHSDHPAEEGELDFTDPANRHIISGKLFRLQKMTKKASGAFEVTYRHHLESTLGRSIVDTKGMTWDEHGSNKHLERLTKVHLNHLGQIIKIGE